MSISPEPEAEEEGHVATRLAGMTAHEFAQSPPEGGYSPTTQPGHSNTPTPTLPPVNLDMPDAFSSNQFGEHVTPALMGNGGGGAPFLYFAPGPPHAAPPSSLHLQPPPSMPFTPTGFSPSSAISFTFDIPPPAPMLMPMAMPNEAFTAEGGYPTLQEPFHPMTPVSRGANLGDQGGERTGKAPVYRPPHLQRQYGPLGQQYSTASTLASPVSQGFSSYQGYDSASKGNYWSSQSSHRPPTHGQYGRRRENLSRLRGQPDIPYMPMTGGSYHHHQGYGSDPRQFPVQEYGLMTPSPSNRSIHSSRGHFGTLHSGPMGSFRFPAVQTPASMAMRNKNLDKGRVGDDRLLVRRSPLLEDFRQNQPDRRWTIRDVWGSIAEFAGDQQGSRFIQQQIESASLEDRERIFAEVMQDVSTLMYDVFGNYVIQKMFEVGHSRQKADLTKALKGSVRSLALHMYGCRVVQKALDYLDGEFREQVIEELEPHVLECVQSNNGNHVIQRLVTRDPPAFLATIFNGHLRGLATNVYGCRVIQKMFELLPAGMRGGLLDELHPLCEDLMQHQYGNYVIQSVLTSGSEADRRRIISRIKGQMLPMSRHKFASNVCEKALQHSHIDDRRVLVEELIGRKADGTTMIPVLLRDAFGNFPLQTALTFADDDQRVELLDLIIPVLPQIQRSAVGRRILSRFQQWEADGLIDSATEAGLNTLRYQERMAGGMAMAHRFSDTFNCTEMTDWTDVEPSETSSGMTSPPFRVREATPRSTASTPVRPLIRSDGTSVPKSSSIAGGVSSLISGETINDEKTLENLLK